MWQRPWLGSVSVSMLLLSAFQWILGDEDRDGTIADAAACPAGMAQVSPPGERSLCMDQFEASHDAVEPQRAASVPQAVPWIGVDHTAAAAACGLAGKRLCASGEFVAACSLQYPYGQSFDASACNGYDAGEGRVVATGAFERCTTTSRIFDLAGNVAEWVSEAGRSERIICLENEWLCSGLWGQSYMAQAPEPACTWTGIAEPIDRQSSDTGFRCCVSR